MLPPLVLFAMERKQKTSVVIAAVSLVGAFAICESRLVRQFDDRLSVAGIRVADSSTRDVLDLVDHRAHPRAELQIVDLATPALGPSFRVLDFYVPEARVSWKLEDYEHDRHAGGGMDRPIANDTREILWIEEPTARTLDANIGATRVLSNELVSVWSSEIGTSNVDVTVHLGDQTLRFHRP